MSSAKLATLISESPPAYFDKLLKTHKISEEEYATLKEIMGRAPTFAELGVFSAMWSEHCSYKSSRIHLKRLPTTGEHVVVGPGENAGVVRLHGKLCVAFKMESHNHPSYIEPYQGAATGVGGILRDVFCMGARPIANLNCLRFGSKKHKKTAFLLEHVVKGIGDYGNCIGIPTVGGNIDFDDSYNGNCLVNAMSVGLIHEDKIFKGYASGEENLVVYVGSSTGRDGIHGATMASASFAASEDSERSAVQVGDPFCEKLLMEATLEVLEKKLVVGLQDMGAAGLSSSSFEMASRAGSGIWLNLDAVPVRTDAMTAYELMLSESQERMLMVIEKENYAAACEVFEKWQLAYAIIGKVTNTKRMQAVYKNVLEIDMPIDPVTEHAPRYDRPRQQAAKLNTRDANTYAHAKAAVKKHLQESDFVKIITQLLASTGDMTDVYRQYDQHIGRKSVLNSTHQGAAVLWVQPDSVELRPQDSELPHLGIGLSTACNASYCKANPKLGAALAVTKAARMLSAVGATPLAITDCLNYGNPEDPAIMQSFSDGIDGLREACEELSIPVVSGNVSLYNQTDQASVDHTPMVGMVGKINDIRLSSPAILPTHVTEVHLALILPKQPQFSFGESLYAKSFALRTNQDIPPINWSTEREAQNFIRHVSNRFVHKPLAIRDVGRGGILTTVLKMALPAGFGIKFQDQHALTIEDLLAEINSTFIVAFPTKHGMEELADELKTLKELNFIYLGLAQKEQQTFQVNALNLDKQTAKEAYLNYLKF